MTEKRRKNLEKWEALISKWRASGLTVAKYCRLTGIPAWKFRYWRDNTKRGPSESRRRGAFLEMAFSEDATSSGKLVVELSSGVRIRLEAGFDPGDLERVLRTLGGASC